MGVSSVCPRCDGTGLTPIVRYRLNSTVSSHLDCDLCNGAGQISESDLLVAKLKNAIDSANPVYLRCIRCEGIGIVSVKVSKGDNSKCKRVVCGMCNGTHRITEETFIKSNLGI